MSILSNYGEVFNKNDAKLFADLFAEDCEFYDTAPTLVGQDAMYVRGKAGIDMIFTMYFTSMRMEAKLVSINDNVMDYDICYVDLPMPPIPCRGTLLEEVDGKIVRYHVVPRV